VTERRYLQDSSVREFDATVTAVRGDRLVLDATQFYPTGGGQPHDTGVLRTERDAFDVVDVELADELEHHLEYAGDDHGLEAGDAVTGVVDDARRTAHSRSHTAQHVLSAVLLETYDARTTGNQVYENRARLDCEHERFDRDDLDGIESRLREVVAADHPVRWYEWVGGEGPRGHCDPGDAAADPLDRTACAGTHVPGTGDIGSVTVTGRETAGSGEERIRFELD